MSRKETRESLLRLIKELANRITSVDNALKFFELQNLKLYLVADGYLLTKDGFLIHQFVKNYSITDNSFRTSLHRVTYASIRIPISDFPDAQELSVEALKELGFETLFFICESYKCSIDWEYYGNAMAEKALRIERKTGVPFGIAHLLATLPDEEKAEEYAKKIREARVRDLHDERVFQERRMIPVGEDKWQMRDALKRILDNDVYYALSIQTRGYRYLNALCEYFRP